MSQSFNMGGSGDWFQSNEAQHQQQQHHHHYGGSGMNIGYGGDDTGYGFNGGSNVEIPAFGFSSTSGGGGDFGGNMQSGMNATSDKAGFDDELSLMEELGINFTHIRNKTIIALNPLRSPPSNLMNDTDLAGPLFFCLLFGGFLLLTGKVHFGYIYGVGVLGCLAIWGLLNLMSQQGVSLGCACSVLGYCMLPIVALSSVAILLSLKGIVGLLLVGVSVSWSSYSASQMFVCVLSMKDQRLLVAYPVALLYAGFCLMVVF